MYWTKSGSIMKAGMDGSGVTVVVSGLQIPNGIVADSDASRLYWADYGATGSSPAIGQAEIFEQCSKFRRPHIRKALLCTETSCIGGIMEPSLCNVALKPERTFVRCILQATLYNI